jgi:hypothetical protein
LENGFNPREHMPALSPESDRFSTNWDEDSGSEYIPPEHSEVKAWTDSLRSFSRSVMVLAGAVLAGVAQLANQLNEASGIARQSAVSALVFSILCIVVGYCIERMALQDAANRFQAVFLGASRSKPSVWGLSHMVVAPDNLRTNRGPDFPYTKQRTQLTTSSLAGNFRTAKWLAVVQSILWLCAAAQYAFALGQLLLE